MFGRSIFQASLLAFFFVSCFDMCAAKAEEEGAYPSFGGTIAIKLQNDWAYDSDDPDAKKIQCSRK